MEEKITVPYIKTNELIAKLQQLGADVTPVKTGIIKPVIIPEFVDKVRSADWIVFTSKNGVRSFFYNLDLAGADIRLIASARFAVVGKATEKRACKASYKGRYYSGRTDRKRTCRRIEFVYGR